MDDSYEAVEKETLTLECEVNKDKINCVWKRYGKLVEESDRIKIESVGRVQRLIISNVNLQDKQSLSCVAIKGRNEDNELATTSTKLTIKEGPLEIVKGLEDTVAKESEDGLLCIELNKPNEEIEWFKNGVKIRPDSKNRIYSNNNKYYLRINDCDPKSDPAAYSIRIRDLESTCQLKVEEKPVEIISGLKDKVCVENQTAKFEIELNKPDVQDKLVWFKNGEEIKIQPDDLKYEIKAIGTKYALVIKKAQFEDEAQYTVKIRDSDLSSSANLSITGILKIRS